MLGKLIKLVINTTITLLFGIFTKLQTCAVIFPFLPLIIKNNLDAQLILPNQAVDLRQERKQVQPHLFCVID